ncbi:aidA [Scenedesmus sp. PABB004]|nr:aidA [Scenedesmus sp. PABB004]
MACALGRPCRGAAAAAAIALLLPLLAPLASWVEVGPPERTNLQTPATLPIDAPGYARTTLEWPCHGDTCEAWLYLPKGLPPGERPPVVLMAHGMGGQKDFGLHKYASKFAEAGLAAFVFDYRGWGGSGGAPRHWLSAKRHMADWRAAIAHVRGNLSAAVDTERLCLWGTSFAGGHVIVVASEPGIAEHITCVVAQVPNLDAVASTKASLALRGPAKSLGMLATGLADLARGALGLAPLYVPLAGLPGSMAFMQMGPGELQRYHAGHPAVPQGGWRNMARAAYAAEHALARTSPIAHVGGVAAPLLLAGATHDSLCPMAIVRRAAALAPRAELYEADCDHFELFTPQHFPGLQAAQLAFIARHVGLTPRGGGAQGAADVAALFRQQHASDGGLELGAGAPGAANTDGLGLSADPRAMGHGLRASDAPPPGAAERAPPGGLQRVAPPARQRPWYASAWSWFLAVVWGRPPDLLGLGPPWIKQPGPLAQRVGRGRERARGGRVAAALAAAGRAYGGGVVTGLRLVDLDLGPVPPRLDGLKVYADRGGLPGEAITLEAALAWGSEAQVTVAVTLTLLGRTLELPLRARAPQLQALARLSVRPLLPHWPFAGSVSACLLEPPHFDIELPLAVPPGGLAERLGLSGLDLLCLPGARGALRLGTRLAARALAVFPRGINVPLVPGGGSAAPCGMLQVRLVRLSGLRSEDLIGHSDPYVVLRVREGRTLRSRTVQNNNQPEYDETFRMLVDDVETQVLQVIVMDEDLFSFTSKVIGVAQMPLKTSAAVAMPRTPVPLALSLHKLMAPTQGGVGSVLELPVRVAGLPITAAAAGGRWLYQNLAGALGDGPRGPGDEVGAGGGRYERVLDATGWLGPSEEYLAEGGEAPGAGTGDDEAPPARPAPSPAGPEPTAPAPERRASPLPAAPAPVVLVTPPSPFAGGAAIAAAPAARPRRPSNGGAATAAWFADDEDDGAGAGAAPRPGLPRLASRSAPLGGFPAGAGEPPPRGDAPRPAAPAARQGAAAPQGAEQEGGGGGGEGAAGVKAAQAGAPAGAEGGGSKFLEGDQVKPVYRGTAFLEVTYTPFRQPDVPATGAGASPAAPAQAAATAAGQRGPVRPDDKGILAVTLVRAKGLTGWQGQADPFCTLTLLDPVGSPSGGGGSGGAQQQRGGAVTAREEQRSSTIYNEDSPRWGEKFDFIMVPAASVLLVTVWDRTSVLEGVASLSVSRERFRNHVLGRVKVPVLDVASAGRIAASWPLQGALLGELELVLQWLPAALVA